MRLRPYQEECLASILSALESSPSTLATLPTGAGKTVVFGHLAQRWPAERGRVLVMAHLDELIGQAARKIADITGETPDIEMGESRANLGGIDPARIVVTSVQTMSRPGRHARFKPEEFGLLIIDEAHHAVAPSYGRVIEHFQQNPEFRVVGVTATPKRTDDVAMGKVFASEAYTLGVLDMQHQGYLVPVEQSLVTVEGVDFSKLRTIAGDFKQDELERLVMQEKAIHGMAKPTIEICAGRPCLVFCASAKHAHAATEVLNRYVGRSARLLLGEQSYGPLGLAPVGKEERRAIINQYRRGDFQFLVGCALFLEGFDAPNTGVVAMWRSTKSVTVYTQALGRGTRPAEAIADLLGDLPTDEARRAMIARSAKPHATVIDFHGNATRLGQAAAVTAVDVLGGDYDAEVRAIARRASAARGGGSMLTDELLRLAADMRTLSHLAEEARKREKVKAEVAYREERLRLGDRTSHYADDDGEARRFDLATDKQVWKLRTLGVPYSIASRYTKRHASKEIGKLLMAQEQREAAAS